MSDTVLALVMSGIFIGSMLICLPVLHSAEILSQGYRRREFAGDVPDLREDDSSPHLTGEIR